MYLRASHEDEKHGEVERVEEHDHRLVPAEHDEHAVHPVRYLRDARHGAALRLDVERVRVLAEPVRQVERLSLREDDERRGEVELLRARQRVGRLRW